MDHHVFLCKALWTEKRQEKDRKNSAGVEMHRAYGLKQHANAGKQSKAIETVREYRKTAEKIARVQWPAQLKGFS